MLPELSGTVCLGADRLLPTRLGSVDPRRRALAGVVRLAGEQALVGADVASALDRRSRSSWTECSATNWSARCGGIGRMLPPNSERWLGRTERAAGPDEKAALHRQRQRLCPPRRGPRYRRESRRGARNVANSIVSVG